MQVIKKYLDLFISKQVFMTICVLGFLQSIFTMSSAYLLIPIVNDGIENGLSSIKNYIIIYIIIFLCMLFIRKYRKKMIIQNALEMEKEKLMMFIISLLHKKINHIEKEKTGQILSSINNDWSQIKEILLTSLDSLTLYPFMFIICFIAISSIRVSLVIVLFPLIFLTSIFTYKKSDTISHYQEEFVKARAQLMSWHKESISNQELIDAYGIYEYVDNKQEKMMKEAYEKERTLYKQVVVSYIPSLVNEYFPMICFALFAFYLLNSNLIQYGELFSLIQMISFISLPMSKFLKSYVNCKNGIYLLARFDHDFNDKETKSNTITIKELEFKNCSYSHPGVDATLINSFDFVINDGNKIAIVGSSGCGKSTLLNLIGGFLEWTNGIYDINGTHINQIGNETLIRSLSYVNDKLYLLPESLEINICCGDNRFADYHEILSKLKVKQNEFENKEIQQNGNNFSGGEKLKINLARALYKNTNLYLFDEPTSHLDKESKQMFYEFFKEIKGSAILVTHDIDCALLCDKILTIDNGNVKTITKEECIDLLS